MSISDHSTLSVTRDHEGLLDNDTAYGKGDLPVNSYGRSPYTDNEIISLDVGQTQTRYRVHRAILSQSPELAAKPSLKLWGEKTNDTILLPELDETTAHTLVHYLYTGRYQTLQAYDDDLAAEQPDKKSAAILPRYKLSTCVYCAAVRYRLPGLAELAKERITCLGEDLSIFDILGIAREDAFPLLSDDEKWLPAYLEDAIKGAVAEDPGLFTRPGFVEQVEGDRRFRQVVMRAVVGTYARGDSAPAASPVAPAVVQSPTPVARDEKPLSEEEVSTTATTTATDPATPVKDESTPFPFPPREEPASQTVTLDAIEPMLASPEPFTDELGFRESKTYRAMGNNSNKKTEPPSAAPVAPAAHAAPAAEEGFNREPAHKRVDSVMLGEIVSEAVKEKDNGEKKVVSALAEKEKEKEKVNIPALAEAVDAKLGTAPDAVPTVNGNAATAGKKGKKNKKKKGAV